MFPPILRNVTPRFRPKHTHTTHNGRHHQTASESMYYSYADQQQRNKQQQPPGSQRYQQQLINTYLSIHLIHTKCVICHQTFLKWCRRQGLRHSSGPPPPPLSCSRASLGTRPTRQAHGRPHHTHLPILPLAPAQGAC